MFAFTFMSVVCLSTNAKTDSEPLDPAGQTTGGPGVSGPLRTRRVFGPLLTSQSFSPPQCSSSSARLLAAGLLHPGPLCMNVSRCTESIQDRIINLALQVPPPPPPPLLLSSSHLEERSEAHGRHGNLSFPFTR